MKSVKDKIIYNEENSEQIKEVLQILE